MPADVMRYPCFSNSMFDGAHEFANLDPKHPKLQSPPVGVPQVKSFWEDDCPPSNQVPRASDLFSYSPQQMQTSTISIVSSSCPSQLPTLERVRSVVGRPEGFAYALQVSLTSLLRICLHGCP